MRPPTRETDAWGTPVATLYGIVEVVSSHREAGRRKNEIRCPGHPSIRDTGVPDCNGVSGLNGGMGYVYDITGRWTMTVTLSLPTGSACSYDIYSGSRHLVHVKGFNTYSHSDWLGTERARVCVGSCGGNYQNNCTSLPFGDALSCTYALNNPYTSPMHFTGKQHDNESGLDNFGARYNSSSFGRFMSPDKLGDQRPEDPQSMNLYSYVRNQPLTHTDPTGRFDCDKKQQECQAAIAAALKIRIAASDINNPNMFALQKVSETLGTYNDHNGVTITSADFTGTANEGSDAKTQGKDIVFSSKYTGLKDADRTAALLTHEGTHVLQNEWADKMKPSSLGYLYAYTDERPSWQGEMNKEKAAYTNQGYMEQALHMKGGDIYDPSDVGPGSDKRRANRIDSGARRSATMTCPSVGDWPSTCQP